jgi:2,4-dienoyl-CoA reductase-like NADH-dependent reductase (Old Yellow Enzyme family)
MVKYKRIASLKTAAEFRAYTAELGIALPLDDELLHGESAPLAQPYRLPNGFTIGNRFCAQPMEGWDGMPDGKPSEFTFRRWLNFGRSGAKLIWGGEAVSVQHDGRGSPNELLLNEENLPALANLRRAVVETHEERFGRSDDLLFGLQLTHAGRFAHPNRNDRLEPCILYRHPLLDRRFGIPDDYPLMTDREIETVIEHFIQAAEMSQQAGFDFVDLKHSHGYLGHEFLSAYTRPGPFGGSFENRTRFLREMVRSIRKRAPGLRLGVRLSAFDMPPFYPGPDGVGRPEDAAYPYPFGADPADPLQVNLDETVRFLTLLEELGIGLVNLSAGNPYVNPHIGRPAMFPPSDGYKPPEDPLVGVARHINVVAQLKHQFPRLAMVGSAYSYLQEWLAHVGQNAVRTGAVDFVGMGRMMLSYPDFPADVLTGRTLDRRRICRTFSDCTTAPRHGLVSGCYPLDPFYKNQPEQEQLAEIKSVMRNAGHAAHPTKEL